MLSRCMCMTSLACLFVQAKQTPNSVSNIQRQAVKQQDTSFGATGQRIQRAHSSTVDPDEIFGSDSVQTDAAHASRPTTSSRDDTLAGEAERAALLDSQARANEGLEGFNRDNDNEIQYDELKRERVNAASQGLLSAGSKPTGFE